MKKIRLSLILFAAAALSLSGASLVMIPLTFPDVHYQRVSFTNTYSSEGESLAGLLVLPEDPVSRPMPAAIFAHGLTACKEFYLSLYRDLAVKGMAVLAVDLPGHGDSRGHSDLGGSEYTALLSAYDWLTADRPDVDPHKVAVMGHSLGGIAATQAGIFQPEGKFCAVVAVFCWQSDRAALEDLFGPIPDYVGRIWPHLIFSRDYDLNDPSTEEQRDLMTRLRPDLPPNYQLIIGALDEFCSVRHERELMARAVGLEDEKDLIEGKIYGDFEERTARQLVVTADNHITEAFSMEVFGAMYGWLCHSFGVERRGTNPVPALRFSIWAVILGSCIAMGLLFTVMLYCLLEERICCPTAPAFSPFPDEPGGRRLMFWASAAYLSLTAALSWPLAAALGFPFLVPFLVGDLVSSLALLRGLMTAAGIAAGIRIFYKMSIFSLDLFHRDQLRCALGALVPPLGGMALLILLYAPLSRLLYLGRGFPFHWGWFIAYVGLVTLLFWAEGRYCHLFLLPLFGETEKRGRRLRYLFSEAGVRTVAQVAAFIPLVSRPWHVIGRPGHIRLPVLAMALFISYPLFLVLGWLNLHFRRRRITLLLPSLGIALLQAWCLTALINAR